MDVKHHVSWPCVSFYVTLPVTSDGWRQITNSENHHRCCPCRRRHQFNPFVLHATLTAPTPPPLRTITILTPREAGPSLISLLASVDVKQHRRDAGVGGGRGGGKAGVVTDYKPSVTCLRTCAQVLGVLTLRASLSGIFLQGWRKDVVNQCFEFGVCSNSKYWFTTSFLLEEGAGKRCSEWLHWARKSFEFSVSLVTGGCGHTPSLALIIIIIMIIVIIIIRNIYMARNPTWLAQSTSQVQTRMNIRINTYAYTRRSNANSKAQATMHTSRNNQCNPDMQCSNTWTMETSHDCKSGTLPSKERKDVVRWEGSSLVQRYYR